MCLGGEISISNSYGITITENIFSDNFSYSAGAIYAELSAEI